MSEFSIAVIGTGYWGKNLVRNFHNLGALHTVCDANPDVVQKFTEQYAGVNGELSFATVLSDPKISGIALATPAETHFSMAKEAILAGKDVYVEKPLSLSEQDGEELSRLAAEQGRVLMVGHLLWYHPVVLKLKGLIEGGELGRIRYIYSNRLNLGKLRREENVLWSFAPHDISVILGLVNEMPDSIRSQGGNFLHKQIADTTLTMLNFASGIRAHIFVSWLHPFKEQKLVVVGDRKMAVFDDTAPWPEKLILYPHMINWQGNIPIAQKAEGEQVAVAQDEPLKCECQHFLECIENRQNPRTDGKEGLRVLRVLNASQHSLKIERAVSLADMGKASAYSVHESAVVDKEASVGEGTKIWHFSHVMKGAKIGRNCNIGQNVVIGPNVAIGNGCKIQNNVSLYEGIVLEDYVFCGPSMVFTNVYNPRAEIRKMDQLRPTMVRRGATLGANSTIVCGISIGEYAFIGAGAVVTRDVPSHALVVGNPARQVGWMSRYGERLDLPLSGEGTATCPATGEKYHLKNSVCSSMDVEK